MLISCIFLITWSVRPSGVVLATICIILNNLIIFLITGSVRPSYVVVLATICIILNNLIIFLITWSVRPSGVVLATICIILNNLTIFLITWSVRPSGVVLAAICIISKEVACCAWFRSVARVSAHTMIITGTGRCSRSATPASATDCTPWCSGPPGFSILGSGESTATIQVLEPGFQASIYAHRTDSIIFEFFSKKQRIMNISSL